MFPTTGTIATNLACPSELAMGADGVAFFTVRDGIDRAPATAPSAGIEHLATAQAAPTAIAVDTNYVYWANAGAGAADGSVMRARRDGRDATRLAEAVPRPAAIAVDATGVVYVVSSGAIAGDEAPFIGAIRPR